MSLDKKKAESAPATIIGAEKLSHKQNFLTDKVAPSAMIRLEAAS